MLRIVSRSHNVHSTRTVPRFSVTTNRSLTDLYKTLSVLKTTLISKKIFPPIYSNGFLHIFSFFKFVGFLKILVLLKFYPVRLDPVLGSLYRQSLNPLPSLYPHLNRTSYFKWVPYGSTPTMVYRQVSSSHGPFSYGQSQTLGPLSVSRTFHPVWY